MASVLAELERVRDVANQGTLIIDGGLGTEITKKITVPDCWWGNVSFVQLQHPQLVQECHKAYIDAGADIIITNTYCCNRNILHTMRQNNKQGYYIKNTGDPTKDADEDMTLVVHKAITAAVEAAKRSVVAAGRQVLIAGSVGTHKLVSDDGLTKYPVEDGREMENFMEAADDLVSCGVDVIFVEMLGDLVHAAIALEAVARVVEKRPCPVFLGIVACQTKTGEIILNRDHTSFTSDILQSWIEIFSKRNIEVAGVNIMHTAFSAVLPVIRIVQEVWSGRIGCYPDLGVYKFPAYELMDIEHEEAVAYCRQWRNAGVSMIGGCCGIGPDLIQKINQAFSNK